MTNDNEIRIAAHESPELFREMLSFTATQSGFAARLIEKDYFCSMLLRFLANTDQQLIFKGGTCLSKIHFGFYRLSEDLDFTIPVDVQNRRADRRRKISGIKRAVAEIDKLLPVFEVDEPLKGANQSTQYVGSAAYRSHLSGEQETIKIEIGLREPLLLGSALGAAKTFLLNPLTGRTVVTDFRVSCLTPLESLAEKFRAALTRREAAIRDFFDLDYAVIHSYVDPLNRKLLHLIADKLDVPGTGPLDLSDTRYALLERQVTTDLRPVLREEEFSEFQLERAFAMVSDLAARLEELK